MIDLVLVQCIAALSLPLQKYGAVHGACAWYIVTGMRLIMSGLPVLSCTYVRRLVLHRPSWRVLIWYGVAFGCGIYGKYVAKRHGIVALPLVTAYAVQGTVIFWGLIVQWMHGRERMTRTRWLWGAVIMMSTLTPAWIEYENSCTYLFGVIMLMGAVVMHCYGTFAIKELSVIHAHDPVQVQAFCAISGGALLTSMGLSGAHDLEWVSTSALIACALNVVVTTVFRYYYYGFMIQKYSLITLFAAEHGAALIACVAGKIYFSADLPVSLCLSALGIVIGLLGVLDSQGAWYLYGVRFSMWFREKLWLVR